MYLQDISPWIILCASTLRHKVQIKPDTASSHGILIPGQSVPALTPQDLVSGRTVQRVSVLKLLVWLGHDLNHILQHPRWILWKPNGHEGHTVWSTGSILAVIFQHNNKGLTPGWATTSPTKALLASFSETVKVKGVSEHSSWSASVSMITVTVIVPSRRGDPLSVAARVICRQLTADVH